LIDARSSILTAVSDVVGVDDARRLLYVDQAPFLDRLLTHLGSHA
jgi:hypothetical protein